MKVQWQVTRPAATDGPAFEHAERGEQGRRAMAFLIVREGRAFYPLSGRPAGSGRAPESAFLFDGDHHCAAGRVHVETDDIIKFGGEVRIVGSLEGLDPARPSDPYALNRSQRKKHRLSDGAAGFWPASARFVQFKFPYEAEPAVPLR